MMNSFRNEIMSGRRKTYRLIRAVFFAFSLVGVIVLVAEAGFPLASVVRNIPYYIYVAVMFVGILFTFLIYLTQHPLPKKKVWFVDFFLFALYVTNLISLFALADVELFNQKIWLNIALLAFLVRAISTIQVNPHKKYLNPAQLFVLSFAGIIGVGTILLMLPNATHDGISFIDALFTSASAVCVTGLVVVDTGSHFTYFGQTILVLLIQAGGIGIMTFSSYFSYFFKGGASYQNRLMLQDMNNSDKIADVFNALKRIILVTFLIEAVGSVIIYFSVNSGVIELPGKRMFFSIFHSVSAFCNAGFSTLPNSLYEIGFRTNYTLHLTIAFLFIMGGLGFPIVFNALTYFKHLVVNRLIRKRAIYKPWVIGINTRIVLVTTAVLLMVGTGLFYLFEADNTLSEHSGFGKVVTSFFGAATPRTAGFNTVDTSALHFSTIMIIMVLMWIGASPGSTGGGVKTSTFALAILNFISIARGKDRVEAFRREISPMSTRRAFAVVSLSIMVIGLSILLLSYSDGNKGLLPIAFESFSAFSTVGLSLGITSQLSAAGKMIIIVTMFIGRVSMLTILVAFMRKMVNLKYKYPLEEIIIN